MEIICAMWHILKICFWYDFFFNSLKIIHIRSNSCLEMSKLEILKLLIEILLPLTYFISSTELLYEISLTS